MSRRRSSAPFHLTRWCVGRLSGPWWVMSLVCVTAVAVDFTLLEAVYLGRLARWCWRLGHRPQRRVCYRCSSHPYM